MTSRIVQGSVQKSSALQEQNQGSAGNHINGVKEMPNRASSSFIHKIRFTVIDRVIQKIADRVNLGGTYKLYRMKCNLELLCKEPGEWKKDKRNFSELTTLARETSLAAPTDQNLATVISSFPEDLLAAGFSRLAEIDNALKNACPSVKYEGQRELGFLKAQFKEQGMRKVAERIEISLKEPSSDLKEHIIQCELLNFEKIYAGQEKEKYYEDLEKILDNSASVKNSATSSESTDRPLNTFLLSILGNAVEGGLLDSSLGKNGSKICLTELDNAKEFLQKVREKPSQALKDQGIASRNSHGTATPRIIGDGKVPPDNIKARKVQLSEAELDERLSKCMNEYYDAVSGQPFESSGARLLVRNLYKNLRSLENNLTEKSKGYFYGKIGTHVKRRELGKAGRLLDEVSCEKEFKESLSIYKFLSHVSVSLLPAVKTADNEKSIGGNLTERKLLY